MTSMIAERRGLNYKEIFATNLESILADGAIYHPNAGITAMMTQASSRFNPAHPFLTISANQDTLPHSLSQAASKAVSKTKGTKGWIATRRFVSLLPFS
ncbi:MAG: hypothetical protein DSY55_01650 [Clostridia bacterium]|nr:MAG: hypothetical protein DSY55_01650 [Clostridia bacterium]